MSVYVPTTDACGNMPKGLSGHRHLTTDVCTDNGYLIVGLRAPVSTRYV